MSDENDAPSSERAGKGSGQAVDPPQIKNFSIQLNWHLRYGTRPEGQPGHPGKEWDLEEFATAIQNIRIRRRNKSSRRHRSNLAEGSARTNLNNWLSGIRCLDMSWANAIETTLFGENLAFDKWRMQLREARRARPQEAGEPVGEAPEAEHSSHKHDVTHDKIDALHIALTPLIEQAKQHGITEAQLRAIIVKIDARKHNAPIQEILRDIESFIDAAIREKKTRNSPSNEIPDLPVLRAAAGKLLEAGELDAVSSPFDAALIQRRRFRAERNAAEIREDVRLIEEAASYDRLSFNIEKAVKRYLEASLLLEEKEQRSYLARIVKSQLEWGNATGDSASTLTSIGLLQELLRTSDRVSRPLDWAVCHSGLGDGLSSLGDRESGTTRLEEALKHYRAAHEEFTKDRDPTMWAMIHSNIGLTLSQLGERLARNGQLEAGIKRLAEAICAYREALKVSTRPHDRFGWARVQHNLGSTFWNLGRLTRNRRRFRSAIAALRKALVIRTPEAARVEWARTQDNLANVLDALGQMNNRPENLEESIKIRRQVLAALDRESAPLQWGLTQYNLGNSLAVLNLQNPAAKLANDAIAAYRSALEEVTPKRMLWRWFTIKCNLATLLCQIGISSNSTTTLIEGIAAHEEALAAIPRGSMPQEWDENHRILVAARMCLAEMQK